MVIARLAPQDYHWFHAPIGGRVVSITDVDGPYWSVSADAARSGNNVYLNERRVVVIDAGPHVGKIAYIGIGGNVRWVRDARNENDAPIPRAVCGEGREVGIHAVWGAAPS